MTTFCAWDTALDLEAAATYRIAGGARVLIDHIAADTTADVRLDTTVVSVEESATGVTVTTAAGDAVTAAAVIVTVPINALPAIEFTPALPDAQRAVVAAGQASRGVKVRARVRGDVRPFLGFAPPLLSPLNIGQFEFSVDGDSLVVAFGSDHTAISVDDREAVERALRHWLPGVEVLEVTGHDWTADEFSRETWANLRPGQPTDGIPALVTCRDL
nr:FAD-dependent oxidoreductase [Aeromicrobium chenweiae]